MKSTKNKKYFLKITLQVFIFFILFTCLFKISTQTVSADLNPGCQWDVKVLLGNNEVKNNGDATVKQYKIVTTQANKLGVSMLIIAKHHSKCNDLKVEIGLSVDKGKAGTIVSNQAFTTRTSEIDSYTYRLGSVTAGNYDYLINDTPGYNIALIINFVNSNTKEDASKDGGDTKTKDDATKTEENKPVVNPNTDVTITPGQSYDTVLGTFYNPFEDSITRPEHLVVRIINALLLLVGIISVIMIIVGGLRMVSSGGNETLVTKGKQTVIWAVGGLLVSLLSFSIVAIIQSIIS